MKQEDNKRPAKPNKFWASSMKKVSNKIGDDQIPRGTDFADLEDFLGKSPDDKDQISPESKR